MNTGQTLLRKFLKLISKMAVTRFTVRPSQARDAQIARQRKRDLSLYPGLKAWAEIVRRPATAGAPFLKLGFLKRQKILRQAGFFVGWGVVACAVGCGKHSPSGANEETKKEAEITRPDIPPAHLSEDGLIKISALRHDQKKLLVELELTSATQTPVQETKFQFTLPPTASGGRAVLNSLTLAENPLPLSGGATTDATQFNQFIGLRAQGYLRRYPLFTLNIKPEFWRMARGEQLQSRVRVEIALPWPGALPRQDVAQEQHKKMTGGMKVLRNLVANPDDISATSSTVFPLNAPGLGQITDPRHMAPQAEKWGRVAIAQNGFYLLTPKVLGSAGMDITTATLNQIHLFSEGREILLLPVPGGLGFYGFSSSSAESREQIYWVAQDQAGSQKTAASSFPDFSALPLEPASKKLTFIRQKFLFDHDQVLKAQHDNLLNIKGLDWVDRELLTTVSLRIPVQLHNPLPAAGANEFYPGKITFLCEGEPEMFSGTLLALCDENSTLTTFKIGNERNSGFDFNLSAALFKGVDTTLTLKVIRPTKATLNTKDEDGVWFDKLEVTYPALPELLDGRLTLDNNTLTTEGQFAFTMEARQTNAGQPLALAIHPQTQSVNRLLPVTSNSVSVYRVVSQAGWHTEIIDPSISVETTVTAQQFDTACLKPVDPAGTDYLIITHAKFKNLFQPLIDLNHQRGLTTQVVDVQKLYDLFSHGRLSSDAIRSYLAYTLKEWGEGAPEYVLLAGDATSDFLNETRSGVKNFVPSHTCEFGDYAWASDYWFTCVAGDDNLGDFVIGRFSVNNETDLKAIIDKTVQYSTQPVWGPWRATVAYVSDNLEEFRKAAEHARQNATPPIFGAERVYLDEMPLEDNWYIPKNHIERTWELEHSWLKVSGAATLAVRNLFNTGVAQLDFFGHGSPNIWTDERIWFGGDSPNRDSLSLKNDGQYPFVINFTCNTGAIDYPLQPWNVCISEDLLRVPHGGAIGLFVPSGPGMTSVHEKFAATWHKILFQDNLREIGIIGTLARERFALNGGALDMVHTFVLLGDPALEMQLARQWHELAVEPAQINPAERQVNVKTDHLSPPAGQAVAWLEDAHGKQLWKSSSFKYSGGKLQTTASIPEGISAPAELRAYVYGWNEQAKTDWVAGGIVRVRQPGVILEEARLEHKTGQDNRCILKIYNQSGYPVTLNIKLDNQDGTLADQWEVTIDGGKRVGETRDFTSAVQITDKPAFFNLHLKQPALDKLELSGEQARILILPPAHPWLELDPLASHRMPVNGTPGVVVKIMGSEAPAEGLIVAWKQAETILTSSTVTLDKTSKTIEKEIQLRRPVLPARTAGEQIVLMRQSGQDLSVLNVDALAAEEPVLHIDSQSIHYHPENPTEGQTIFVTFDVENIGNAVSAPVYPMLLDREPGDPQARQLPMQTLDTRVEVPALGAGRRASVALRWDPRENAGVQNIGIDLKGSASLSDPERRQQLATVRLFVRSKAKLVRQRIYASLAAGDEAAHRVRLHCVVGNEGETEAHNVVVSFFKGKEQTPEEKLGQATLPEITAKSSAEAELVWEYDPNVWTAEKLKGLTFTTEIRIKGSSQRLAEE